jgi:hypothetical protein
VLTNTVDGSSPDTEKTPGRTADLAVRYPGLIRQAHRIVAILAIIGLYVDTVTSFDTVIWNSALGGIVMTVGYAGALACGVAVLAVRGDRGLFLVDLGILVTALLLRIPEFCWSLGQPQAAPNARYLNDEGALVDLGGRVLHAGHNPYTAVWAGAHDLTFTGITATMGGGAIDRFDYPPVTALLAALSRTLLPTQPSAAIVGLAGLLATTILLFWLLPSPWKSAATLVCLSVGLYLMSFARQGYPEIVALPFVLVAVYRWTAIGRDGRLGRLGVVSAVCLGLACATQQLAWFLVPFLVVGLLLVRLGDRPARQAWRLTAVYVAIVIGVFVVINAPFVVWSPHAWIGAMVTPLFAPTLLHGQGIIGITYSIVNGSGNLAAFGYATGALAIALLVTYALFIRTLGPTMVMLPWVIFFCSIRSSDKYFYLMAPIWLLSIAFVRHRDFAACPVLPWRAVRPILAAALFVPVIVLSGIGLATPAPLRMTLMDVTSSKTFYTEQITVRVANRSGTPISPHFALSTSINISRYWQVTSGPRRLVPGASAVYVLVPPNTVARRNLYGPHIELRAMSGYPETMSSVPIPMLGAVKPTG